MSTATANMMFLRWLRTTAPHVYDAAMNSAFSKVRQRPAGLAGLGDDMPSLSAADETDFSSALSTYPYVDSGSGTVIPTDPVSADAAFTITPDLSVAAVDSSTLPIPNVSIAPGVAAAAPTSSSGINWTSLWTTAINDVTSIAPKLLGIGTPSATLVQTNAARVAQGLPPLNADGSVMTQQQLAASGYTSAQIAQMEANLARGGALSTGLSASFLGLPLWAWLIVGGGAMWAYSRR